MKFTKQIFAGILIGLAFGMLIGAALADGKKEVNYTSMAGVGVIFVTIAGVTIGRSAPAKS